MRLIDADDFDRWLANAEFTAALNNADDKPRSRVLYIVKGTRGPEESEENSMGKFANSIKRNGGFIVHKPSKVFGVGLVYKGNDGDKPVFGHDCAMIFLDECFAWSVAHDLGDEWMVMDVRDITPERFMEMEALAAIFD